MPEQNIPPSESPMRTYFSKAVSELSQRRLKHGECQTPDGKSCTLCVAYKIDYDIEHEIKNAALQKFWNAREFGRTLEPLIASPLGRNYRVVTKRKVFVSAGKARLGLIGIDEEGTGLSPLPVDQCVIEPEAHARIYRSVQSQLGRSESRDFAEVMNYVIVKGNYDEYTVIFNLAGFTPVIRQFINRLSKRLTETIKGITGIFIVVDERRSHYYMPQRREKHRLQYQKIFGKSEIFQNAGGKKFLFSPLSFSQTNLSILEVFISTMKDLLDLEMGDHILDLYSGYGIFSLSLADKVRKVTGIEISRDAVHDSIENARRLSAFNCTYLTGDIDGESLERTLSSHRTISKVILDPPRNGTKPDVIEIIAAKNIQRALHIFCNIDLMPAEVKRWSDCGYKVLKAVPFDMFPGTSEVEIMILLAKR